MKALLKSIFVTSLFMVMALQMVAQDKNKAHMLDCLEVSLLQAIRLPCRNLQTNPIM